MLDVDTQIYHVIPLSVQKERGFYLVGNSDIGDYYQFPDEGVKILNLLASGHSASTIKSQLAAEQTELVDVDSFVQLLSTIGFIYPLGHLFKEDHGLQFSADNKRRVFDVDEQIAKTMCSLPVLLICIFVILYAISDAFTNPALRPDLGAFYFENNRTIMLLTVMALGFIQVAMHEIGHMLAAARHGIKSRYGISNRLWAIVAESDLTGILSLPKSQRYFPMLAGLFVDIVCASLLTLLIGLLLQHGASAFSIHVCRALVLEILVSVIWQFNIFVKTDIYFVLCNYFGHPDLDRDARIYLKDLLYKTSLRYFGSNYSHEYIKEIGVLRVFALIWFLGRALSLLILATVFIPTAVRYIESAVNMLSGPPGSIWVAFDMLVYICITLTMLCVGMYMWLNPKLSRLLS